MTLVPVCALRCVSSMGRVRALCSAVLCVAARRVLRFGFIQSFIRSFVQLFNRSFLHSFNCSIVHSFIRSFVHLFNRSIVRSIVRSFIRSIVQSFIPSFVQLFNRSFLQLFNCSIVQLFNRSFVHSFNRSIVQTFIHSFIHSEVTLSSSILSGARQVLKSSQDFVALLEKHRLLWMEEDALDGLSFHSPRVLSNVCFVGGPCQSAGEALDFKRSHGSLSFLGILHRFSLLVGWRRVSLGTMKPELILVPL